MFCFLLSSLEVNRSGLIEDQLSDALEIDFANKYIGGGALHKGCVQVCVTFDNMQFLFCFNNTESYFVLRSHFTFVRE